MKANELMLDDWIQIVDDAPTMPGEYHKVDWIRTGELGLDNRKIVTYPYVQPVPLTQEILEKNFERNSEEDGYLAKAFKFAYFENIHRYWNIMWFEDSLHSHAFIEDDPCIVIKYVHQLQHALKLCGIEKEIVL